MTGDRPLHQVARLRDWCRANYRNTGLSTSELLTMWALAWDAGKDEIVWSGNTELAMMGDVAPRQITDNLRALQHAGLIELVTAATGGRRARYRLTIPQVEAGLHLTSTRHASTSEVEADLHLAADQVEARLQAGGATAPPEVEARLHRLIEVSASLQRAETDRGPTRKPTAPDGASVPAIDPGIAAKVSGRPSAQGTNVAVLERLAADALSDAYPDLDDPLSRAATYLRRAKDTAKIIDIKTWVIRCEQNERQKAADPVATPLDYLNVIAARLGRPVEASEDFYGTDWTVVAEAGDTAITKVSAWIDGGLWTSSADFRPGSESRVDAIAEALSQYDPSVDEDGISSGGIEDPAPAIALLHLILEDLR